MVHKHAQRIRYALELDVLERRADLGDRRAMELLYREFQLALNASHFSVLADGDVAVTVLWRDLPQEGVARYGVELELRERLPGLSDEGASELVRREFRRALNASHFWRVCVDDFRVTMRSRTPVRDFASPRSR